MKEVSLQNLLKRKVVQKYRQDIINEYCTTENLQKCTTTYKCDKRKLSTATNNNLTIYERNKGKEWLD